MKKLETFLRSKLENAVRIAILAIGSDLRGDDAAGPLVAQKLTGLLKGRSKKVKIFLGATAPENLTGDIKKFKPSHIILIDSVDFKNKPGSIIVLSPRDIGGGVSFSTHKMPARVLIDYFSRSLECEPFLIGIQPASVDFGRKPSNSVVTASKDVATAIARALKG